MQKLRPASRLAPGEVSATTAKSLRPRIGPGLELRAAAAAEEQRPGDHSPGKELQQLREDLARFTSEGSAKLCALDADLRAFLGEQQEAVELARDLKQLLGQRR
eukprot:s94_g12.t1